MFFRQNPSDRPTVEPPHCSIRAQSDLPPLLSSTPSSLRLSSPIFIDFQTFAILPPFVHLGRFLSVRYLSSVSSPLSAARFSAALPPSIESKYAYRDSLYLLLSSSSVSLLPRSFGGDRTCRMAPKVTKSFCRTPTAATPSRRLQRSLLSEDFLCQCDVS